MQLRNHWAIPGALRPESLEEKVLRRLLKRQRIPAVPHGFRSSFRDWTAEETWRRREVMEAAPAHVVGNKVEVHSPPAPR